MISNLTLSLDVFNTPDICTKMKIMHAVDKSLDRVTISEICEKAGISRQTFYRHFKSKYDIPWWFSIFCRQFYLNEIGRTIDWHTGYYHHIRLIATERDFFPQINPVQHQHAIWPDHHAAKSQSCAAGNVAIVPTRSR